MAIWPRGGRRAAHSSSVSRRRQRDGFRSGSESVTCSDCISCGRRSLGYYTPDKPNLILYSACLILYFYGRCALSASGSSSS